MSEIYYYYLVKEARIHNNITALHRYIKTKEEFENFKKIVPYNFKTFEVIRSRKATPEEIKEEKYNRSLIKTLTEHPNIKTHFNNKKG